MAGIGFGMTFKDLHCVATGERLTAESLRVIARVGGSSVCDPRNYPGSRRPIRGDGVGDGRIENGRAIRAVWALSLLLGLNVREQQALSLMRHSQDVALARARLRKLSRQCDQRQNQVVPMPT